MAHQPTPSTTAANGDRDARGRFAPGNRAAVGNPHASAVARLRSTILSAVSEDDIRATADKVVELALSGDLDAIKLLWDRLFGRPAMGLYAADGPSGEPTRTPEQIVRLLLRADMEDRVPPGLAHLIEPVRASLEAS